MLTPTDKKHHLLLHKNTPLFCMAISIPKSGALRASFQIASFRYQFLRAFLGIAFDVVFCPNRERFRLHQVELGTVPFTHFGGLENRTE